MWAQLCPAIRPEGQLAPQVPACSLQAGGSPHTEARGPSTTRGPPTLVTHPQCFHRGVSICFGPEFPQGNGVYDPYFTDS